MIRRVLLFILFSSTVSLLHAEKFNLNIYAGRFDSIPIGIVDFKTNGATVPSDQQPWAIIANDFDLCGRFQVVHAHAFDSAAFAAKNIGFYIDGTWSTSGPSVTFNCYVNDVASREHLFEKSYTGPASSVRRLAHSFSNELYNVLFGDKGIFDTRILYVKAAGGAKNIAIMDFDGFNRRQLTHGSIINLFPAFADSMTGVWTSFLRGKPDLYRGSLADGSVKVIAASRGIQVSPAVSPIDETVVYASSAAGSLDIYTCALDGSNKKKMTAGGGIETAPCWSPNGYQIAYTSDRAGNPQIFVMDADGGNQHRVTHKSRYSDSPSWSPKGDRIAFTSMTGSNDLDVWVVSTDGSNEMQLTNFPGRHEYPTWSPDGALIGFITTIGGKSDFCVMKPDGSHVRQVTKSGDVRMPDWQHF